MQGAQPKNKYCEVINPNDLLEKGIPIIKDKFIYNLLKEAYYGGLVDVYKTKVENGYYYDVNSLYPYSMMKDMPVGTPRLVSGNIDINNFFGFVHVNIKTNNYIHIPLLPVHLGKRLINANGSWSGWYFSEEIKAALNTNVGYNIEIIEGIKFNCLSDGGKIFTDYVSTLYEKKYDWCIKIYF
jgi:hypothetical protein